jgi:tetratricopeptide (TPR) repeat protein
MAGQWAQFAGWLHENTGQSERATRLYGEALGYAVAAGNADLTAEVISLKGHLAWNLGHLESVILLSQEAQRDPRAFPGQHAISAAQEARVHAVFGDADATDRKLDDALRLAALAAERPEEAPPWLYYHSSAFFSLHRGRAYRYLGRTDPARNRRAIETLTEGLGRLPDEQRQADWVGEYVRQLALAHVQAGGIEEACASAREAVAIARRTGSTALLARIDRLHARLAERLPRDPAVVGLGEALRSGQALA